MYQEQHNAVEYLSRLQESPELWQDLQDAVVFVDRVAWQMYQNEELLSMIAQYNVELVLG